MVQRYISSNGAGPYLLQQREHRRLPEVPVRLPRYEWERDHYLTTFEETHKAHHAAVEGQIREFERALKDFNAAVDAYNADVDRYNRREIAAAPTLPAEPVIPEPLPVPEILAAPRGPLALSQRSSSRPGIDI